MIDHIDIRNKLMLRKSIDSIDSFTTCHVQYGSDRSSGKLHLMPYFGHFSGEWVTFDVRKKLDSAGNLKIKVKIEGCQNPSPYLFLRCDKKSLGLKELMTQTNLKDMCLKYLHKSEHPNLEINRQPSRLVFLCERKILLNLNVLNSSVLPSVSFSHLNPETFCTQDLFIKMWYGSSRYPAEMMRMKVRQGISISELKWMLSSKISMINGPSDLELYEYNSTEKLPDHFYLTPEQLTFHCIVILSLDRDLIVVSLVGQGIEQIKVKPSMTLNEFQAKVREKFSLNSSSFIYFPSICRNKNVCHYNQVTMSALLDKSTFSLVSSKRRNLPIIDGIPLSMLKYDQLKMYKLSMSDLDLISSNLVRAYEVAGPTIPISFRTATSVVGKGEFVLISNRPHAVSINLNWSVKILLKYIEDICHFPCEKIAYEGSILPYHASLHQYFTNTHWNTKPSFELVDIPKVLS